MGVADRLHDITEIAQPGVDPEVVGDVVAVVAIGGRIPAASATGKWLPGIDGFAGLVMETAAQRR
jgi:hypothetical protein